LQNFDNEIVSIQKHIYANEEQEQEGRETNPGPDYRKPVKQPIKFVYCALCSSELQKRKPVECDFNPGIFKLRYYCSLCQLDYWGLSIDKLVLVRDNETRPIVEVIE
jgi:hypothetical protein